MEGRGCNVPAVPVKIFIFLHFVLTSWAVCVDWLPSGYVFCHLMLLVFGIWAVIQPSSHDANQLFLLGMVFAIINDCVLIGIYFNQHFNKQNSKLRFAVACAFLNLFLKPVTTVFILLGYQDNAGGFDYTQAFSSEHRQYQDIPGNQGQTTVP